jgi:hypothetical protein
MFTHPMVCMQSLPQYESFLQLGGYHQGPPALRPREPARKPARNHTALVTRTEHPQPSLDNGGATEGKAGTKIKKPTSQGPKSPFLRATSTGTITGVKEAHALHPKAARSGRNRY